MEVDAYGLKPAFVHCVDAFVLESRFLLLVVRCIVKSLGGDHRSW